MTGGPNAAHPWAFDPDLILLNMVTIADAAGVFIVTGCKKNGYKPGGFCQVVGMPCVRSPIFLRVKAVHPLQRRLRCPRPLGLAHPPPKSPASRHWRTSAPALARRTRRCATC